MTDTERSPSLAVLIDADNTSARYAQAIFEEIATLGEANVRRIYGDFSGTRLGGWNEAIQSLAILQHQQRNNTTGKNAADIALVIDAIDLMHKGKLDGFCLVSSDSDFTRLAQRLREDGLKVYGFGERKTPEAFRSACNRFIYVENLLSAAIDESKPKQAGATRKPGSSAKADPAPEPKKEPASRAVPTLLKAMVGLEDDEGWARLGRVGSRIANIAPDFDPRTYGHSKLGTLVEKSGGFDIKRLDGTGLMIRPKNPKRKSAAK
jgi:NYN domain/OST-HTH/LOTUS domain